MSLFIPLFLFPFLLFGYKNKSIILKYIQSEPSGIVYLSYDDTVQYHNVDRFKE
jgi:hypothetical protein